MGGLGGGRGLGWGGWGRGDRGWEWGPGGVAGDEVGGRPGLGWEVGGVVNGVWGLPANGRRSPVTVTATAIAGRSLATEKIGVGRGKMR